MRRKSVCTTAKQRTHAAHMRCWWRTIGKPIMRDVVQRLVDDWFAQKFRLTGAASEKPRDH